MKILVFSDSHGRSGAMVDAVFSEKPDAILHLGDGLSDTDDLLFFEIPIYKVCGNNDYCSEARELLLTLFGKKLFMTHGHFYGVKNSTERVVFAAKKAGAEVVLFGHTHTPVCENTGEILILNPGSVGYKDSYGVIEIKGKEIKIDVKFI